MTRVVNDRESNLNKGLTKVLCIILEELDRINSPLSIDGINDDTGIVDRESQTGDLFILALY